MHYITVLLKNGMQLQYSIPNTTLVLPYDFNAKVKKLFGNTS